ncbi:hypothetical protein JI529_15565 [Listeria monocytogenes]|nr:hypothetical protein [Listeria monocytogenes]MCH5001761.1 hypothetical protein [Listeria monocytogenes]MCH5007647.1 hypothetical protein [Listeria monocytogenes]MCH5100440.1 hypothetical protein [Listeria monocytogenes]
MKATGIVVEYESRQLDNFLIFLRAYKCSLHVILPLKAQVVLWKQS